ncbi:hypothetical protein HanIR_Chr05g0236531 [Helianthus annuus]|nr:hypothetical protein HanIR_Chr05g0236531 [Helianthus annuus]
MYLAEAKVNVSKQPKPYCFKMHNIKCSLQTTRNMTLQAPQTASFYALMYLTTCKSCIRVSR